MCNLRTGRGRGQKRYRPAVAGVGENRRTVWEIATPGINPGVKPTDIEIVKTQDSGTSVASALSGVVRRTG